MAPLEQVTAEVIRQRLFGAGFARTDATRYERRHDRDASYAVRVHVAPTLVRVVAVQYVGQGEREVFQGAGVDRLGSAETVLDRMIERAREAYAAINHHRRGAA